jgi:hypothetical protein
LRGWREGEVFACLNELKKSHGFQTALKPSSIMDYFRNPDTTGSHNHHKSNKRAEAHHPMP